MKIKFFQIIFLILPLALYSSGGDSLSIKTHKKKHSYNEGKTVSQFFQFPDIDKKFPIDNLINNLKIPDFTFDNIEKEFPQTNEVINDTKLEAAEGFKEIDSTGKWITSFSNEDIQVLPVGIKHKINEVEYQIGFMKAKFTKDYTELVVFVKVILPQTKDGLPVELFFGTNNMKISNQGGIMEEAQLVLLGDIFIPFSAGNWLLILKGGFDYETSDIENRTYITIDCDGVKEMSIEGEVQFSRNIILPVDENGKVESNDKRMYKGALKEPIQIPNRVVGEFRVITSDWNDIIVEISLSPFVLASNPDKFIFSANKAVFDFSDLRTENVTFPQYYYDHGLLLPSEDTWRGVFVESLEISLPSEFKTKETIQKKERVSFEAANLLIDSHGVSGSFSVNNLIPLNSGRTSDTNAWAYSLDHLTIEILSNRLVGVDFDGRIELPLSKESDAFIEKQEKDSTQGKKLGLKYRGLIAEDEYLMSIASVDTIDMSIFSAKAQLLPDSSIELAVRDHNFRPKAVLNGRMAIFASQKATIENEGDEIKDENGNNVYDEDDNKKLVEFKGIEFRQLVLQTESPLITVDYFGYKDKVELVGFPVSIANIALNVNDNKTQLDFDLNINLMGENDKGFTAKTRLAIKGKKEESEHKQHWKYDGLSFTEIILEANLGPMKLNGSLSIREDDPVYGEGFSGELSATFGSIGPVKSKSIFGKKGFRYWYVDAAIHGLKIQVGALQITGLAGGAFYKMTRKPGNIQVFSPSGLSYIPNENSSLGVKTMVFGAIASENTVSFGAGYEIEFRSTGGVNRMGFYGEMQILKPFDYKNPVGKLQEKLTGMVNNDIVNGIMDSKAGKTFLDKAKGEYDSDIVGDQAIITAFMGMEFDFVNHNFHATLNLYVNTIGGFIRGVGERGRAGWGEVYIGRDEWFVYMGKPNDRIGLKMGVGSLYIKTDGYFMTGTQIPGSPPPPPIVADVLGVEANSLDYMRDENALGRGQGFAFGTNLSMDTGDIRFLMFYARFQAGIGFDLMMKNYGDAQCSNTGDQVGINGWYTNGQAYAYLQGELGIRIRIFGIKKKVSIFKGGGAILMQAKLPNPFWMRGYMSGRLDILGGLVSGSFRFKVTIGKECIFEDASPINGIKMIADVSPSEGDSDVDVFTSPQATFSLKVNKPIVIPEDSGDKTYKVILEKFVVLNEAKEKIKGNLKWGFGNGRVTFVPDDILPPSTQLKATVEVSFQEKINGVFETIMEDGKKAVEIEERSFITGTAPDYIPLHNIQYSYPVVDQQQFYSDEYETGYIKLKLGQDYLFENTKWQSLVKYENNFGDIIESNPNYNPTDNRLYYDIPNTDKETEYKLTISSFSKSSEKETTTETLTEKQEFDEENIIEIKQNSAETVFKEGGVERLTYSFKTSKYRSFSSKINSIDINEDNWGKITSDVIYLSSKIKTHEGFDLVELLGNKYTENKALVVVESDLKDTYFIEDIDPMLYQKFELGSEYTINRDPLILGFRPKRALPILSNYLTSLENNVNLDWKATRFPYRYNLPQIYHTDYVDLRDRIVNDYVNGLININAPELSIMEEDYKLMLYGKYNIKLQYNLPGGIKGSFANYKFKNPLSLRK